MSARPGPAAVEALLPAYVRLDSPPVAAVELIARVAQTEAWFPTASEAAEFAEKVQRPFLKRLGATLSEYNAAGRFCEFELNSSSQYMVQGACFIEGTEPPDVADAKRRRISHADYLSELRALTPDQFEAACRGILRELGVRDAAVTQHSADQGIDFYGRLHLVDELRRAVPLPGLYTRLTIWLVGQAKHYDKVQAATPDVRAVVGSVQLARARAFPAFGEQYADLHIRLCDPVYYLFFTTGSISTAGWSLLDASGVVGMDGPMLAAFLADHGVACINNAFDAAAFVTWVDANAAA